MTRHTLQDFEATHGLHDHSAHQFHKNLSVAFELPRPGRAAARAREIVALGEAGPKQFVHSRFRGDATLYAVLNNRTLLRRGTRGVPVAKIQQALLDLGHPLPRFGADGDFGLETYAAVLEFQRWVRSSQPGFAVDGIIGPMTMEALDLAISRLRLRKSVTALSATEHGTFAAALEQWNCRGLRRQFVIDHYHASNLAHGNSGFLPWHRQFLLNFESELNAIDDTVALPYWDWISDPGVVRGAPSWNAAMTALFGGNGTGAPVRFNGRVIGRALTTGPIRHWRFIDRSGRTTTTRLARAFNAFPARLRAAGRIPRDGLPSSADLASVVAVTPYDASDFGQNPPNPSFRSALERILHNYVHIWVGGQMQEVAISPNDPAFFLHHCMVDGIWAAWQQVNPRAGYLPTRRTGRAPGPGEPMPVRNLDSGSPGTVTPAATWDIANLSDNLGNTGLRVRYV